MFLYNSRWNNNYELPNKTFVITGGNEGIGKAMVKELYIKGARVIIACRNVEKANNVVQEIKENVKDHKFKNDIIIKQMDLADFASIRKCAQSIVEEESEINVLINNAGVFGTTGRTNDGFEMHIGVNHLGHFLFTLLLLPTIIKSAPARIVTVSSSVHCMPVIGNKIDLDDLNYERRSFSSMKAYSQSKLANVLFTKELDRRLKAAGVNNVTTYAVHPGLINTSLAQNFMQGTYGINWLWSHMVKCVYSSPEDGSRNVLYCALEEKIANKSGLYYSNMSEAHASSLCNNENLANRLWEDSLKYTSLTNYNAFKRE